MGQVQGQRAHDGRIPSGTCDVHARIARNSSFSGAPLDWHNVHWPSPCAKSTIAGTKAATGEKIITFVFNFPCFTMQVPTLVVLLSDGNFYLFAILPHFQMLLIAGFSQDDALQPAQSLRQLPNLQFYTLSIGQLSNK